MYLRDLSPHKIVNKYPYVLLCTDTNTISVDRQSRVTQIVFEKFQSPQKICIQLAK